MDIKALGEMPDGRDLSADLIIVGAGPAGLTIARELARSGIDILMLESGIHGPQDRYRELNRVESRPSAFFEPLGDFRRRYHTNNCPIWDPEIETYGMRLRAFGGSSAYWGGKVSTFAPIDFAPRAWVPHSGWPIDPAILDSYVDRAGIILNLGPNVYTDALWPILGKTPFAPPIDPAKLEDTFWQFARSRVDKLDMVRFGKEYLDLDAPDIRVLIDATVTRIDLEDGATRFAGLEVATLDGKRHRVRGAACVLAASAIENARLLLASDHQCPGGIGNAHDQVGRYLMDHPGAMIGHFRLEDLEPIVRRFGFFGLRRNRQTHMYMHGLQLAPAVQESEQLLHAALFMLEGLAPDDPFKAAVRLAKRQSDAVIADLRATLASLPLLIKGVGMKLFQSSLLPERLKDVILDTAMRINPNWVVREYQNINMPHKLSHFEVHAICEQRPDPDSRIRLGDTRDAFGIRRPLAEWRPGLVEARSIMRLAQLLDEECARIGLPRPVLAEWIVASRPQDARLIDMAHTLGTTRMAADPAEGVVDTDCRVHGIDGLYIAGGSVLPTSGHANPTLMILSLAIRLADHIKTVARFAREAKARAAA